MAPNPRTTVLLETIFEKDLTLDSLSHAYDPAKAREYYLRTRKLKGRKTGEVKVATPKSSAAKRAAAAAAKKAKAARIKAASEKRVFELKVRLQKLEDALDTLAEKAKARSGVDPKATKKKAPAATEKNRKPLTTAQKRKAAKEAEERRERDGDQSLSAQEKTLEAKIESARKRIDKMKVEIELARRKAND